MVGGLVAGYGTFVVMAGRFLYPAGERAVAWQFVATVDQLQPGESIPFVAPSGAKLVVARQGEGNSAEDFIALSSVCPHLGCQVHWEPQRNRFFCPCHNGVFNPQGKATEGPPAAAGQSLSRFPLKVENNLLYIEAPLESVIGTVAQSKPDRSAQLAQQPQPAPQDDVEEA
jgi:Rieske Fe-S protein